MALQTLKTRPEFLAVRGGSKASVAVCLIEAKARAPDRTASTGPRFGFTVTKKLGNAVTRNRIRRRLKAALSRVAPSHARDGFDYVVVARSAAFDRPFEDMVRDLERALTGVHTPQGKRTSKDSTNTPRR